MMEITEHGPLTEKILHMLDEEYGRERITTELLEQGYDEEIVKELVKESIKLRHSKRMSQGLTLILIGAVICFASFLLTITSSFSHSSFPIVLYGMTSAGILVVFAGFTKVF